MSKKGEPIKPSEVAEKKGKNIPKEVSDVFNELIVKEYNGSSATIRQDEVVKLLVKKGLKESEILKNRLLDVEDVYRKAGWKVEYDKPGFNEDYDATFKFTKNSNSR
jgi:hypothetical protein